ncbi:hypothetical protein ACX0G9_25870 [Flavitalea flava]
MRYTITQSDLEEFTADADEISIDFVRIKVVGFYTKMKRIAEFLYNNKAPADLQIEPSDVLLQFYIDQDGLTSLNTIAQTPGFSKFGVFFGLEDPVDQSPVIAGKPGFGRITSCFVGLGDDENILPIHFLSHSSGLAGLNPEDTWPPKPPPHPSPTLLGLSSPSSDVDDFFKDPFTEKFAALVAAAKVV